MIARAVMLVAQPELHAAVHRSSAITRISCVLAALISEISFACGPRSLSRCCIASTRSRRSASVCSSVTPLSTGRRTELSAESRAARLPHPSASSSGARAGNRQFRERHRRALRDVITNPVRPDARDGGRSHPVDRKQMAPALGQRHLENALAEIRRETLACSMRCMYVAVTSRSRSEFRRFAARSKARIAQQERMHFLAAPCRAHEHAGPRRQCAPTCAS